MTILHIDFETASRCDLRAEGLANYAADPSTIVHCMAYAFDDEAVDIMGNDWAGWVMPPRIEKHIQGGGLVYAHNAAFELAVWNQIMVPRFGWPKLDPAQCRCTMAMAYAMGLPGALENAAPALGLDMRKDAAGKRVMLQLCRPRPEGRLWRPDDDPIKFADLYEYCKQDVEVERALHQRLMELSASEQALWVLDYQINQQGVRVDLPAISQALKLVETEKARLDGEMLKTTGGVVGSCTEVQLLVKWIRAQGVELTGVAKADVLDSLAGGLPPAVRRALELRKEAAKSSTAKLLAMKERASADSRVRGIHQYHGASTGRWAGRGIQPQNLPRPRPGIKPKDVHDMIDMFKNPGLLDMSYGPIMDALADCVRGMIIPDPGHDLVAVDFSAIEARVLAWLAGEEAVLNIFRTHGRIYEAAAAGIYHVPMAQVDKTQRQIGKVAVLALGYGGGVGAFQSMARNYNITIEDVEADDIKKAWRLANPAIVKYWWALERAAMDAVAVGGTHTAGPVGRQVAFKRAGSFLWCKLPSGRVLCYPYPEVRATSTPNGSERDSLTYMTVVSNVKAKLIEDPASSGTWKRVGTYGGSLAENVTQAVARDLLASAMLRLAEHDAKIVLHCHDEVVIEAPICSWSVSEVEALMAEAPSWAAGLPLAAEGWRGTRYRK